MHIHIYSLKQSYYYIAAGEVDLQRSASILNSSYPIQTEKLGPIPYVFCQYDDVEREIPGRSFPLRNGALAVAAFIRSLDDKITDLYCCCDGGCRRSAAVACSVMRYWGMDEFSVWGNPAYEPNPLVYKMMCEVLGVPVTDQEVNMRVATSRLALKNSINH